MAAVLSERAGEVLAAGSIKVRVSRSGIYQRITFAVKVVRLGNVEYKELFSDKLIDSSEIQRVAEETGLPVEAQNGRAFPRGTSSADFQNL